MSVAAGLDPTKVGKVVTGADVGSLEFLNRGEVDGFITYLGSETAFKQRKIELYYLNTDEFAKMPGDSYFVKKTDVENQAEVITGFLGASRRGYQFLEREEPRQGALRGRGVQQGRGAATRSSPAQGQGRGDVSSPKAGGYLTIDMPAWEAGLELMRKAGIVKDTARPVGDFVTTEFVDAI